MGDFFLHQFLDHLAYCPQCWMPFHPSYFPKHTAEECETYKQQVVEQLRDRPRDVKKLADGRLVHKFFRFVQYCPRCQTPFFRRHSRRECDESRNHLVQSIHDS